MTKPVNLYLLSRIPGEASFNTVHRHVAAVEARGKTPIHEIHSLKIFVDRMVTEGVSIAALDGFFMGYDIPQIGKEFDLLKFGSEGCLNVELKSQPVPLEQIRAQLIKNRHYLSHLGIEMQLFTFVSDTRECYRLSLNNMLVSIEPSEIADAIENFSMDFLRDIDGLFRPSEYIVSPSRTPEKYLMGEYFLTQAQDQIRRDLLEVLGSTTGRAFFSLTGRPGTGKTLLLYDIARTLGNQARTAIIHWGDLEEGHNIINEAKIGLTIIPVKALSTPGDSREDSDGNTRSDSDGNTRSDSDGNTRSDSDGETLRALTRSSYVLVDESHRLLPEQFQTICDNAKRYHQRVVFCLDPDQVLTTREKKNNIEKRIKQLQPQGEFVLSERLRGNRQLAAFIRQVRDLNDVPKTPMRYTDVDLGFASTIAEAQNQLAYYRDRGYVFINYTRQLRSGIEGPESDNWAGETPGVPSTESPGSKFHEPFEEFEGGYDIHHVIGQEFDRVVMLMGKSFRYSEDDRLEGVPKPDPDYLYPNLFYQGITRVQEKLALIILENEALFDRIAEILD